MIAFALVDPASGRIVQTGLVPDIAHLDLQSQITGLVAVEAPAGVEQATHYWTWRGFAELPPKPGDWAVWSADGWIDPRTDADLAAELEARRAAATLTKAQFLQACMSAGLLTPAEAADAAIGSIPASFVDAFDHLPTEVRDSIRVIWPSVTTISRNDPLILELAAVSGISDSMLDHVFGIGGES